MTQNREVRHGGQSILQEGCPERFVVNSDRHSTCFSCGRRQTGIGRAQCWVGWPTQSVTFPSQCVVWTPVAVMSGWNALHEAMNVWSIQSHEGPLKVFPLQRVCLRTILTPAAQGDARVIAMGSAYFQVVLQACAQGIREAVDTHRVQREASSGSALVLSTKIRIGKCWTKSIWWRFSRSVSQCCNRVLSTCEADFCTLQG